MTHRRSSSTPPPRAPCCTSAAATAATRNCRSAGPCAPAAGAAGGTRRPGRPASGAATLISWTSSPVRTAEGTAPGPVIGLVELAEGPWLETQLRGLTGAPAELAEGAAFHVGFEQPEGSEPIPVFIAG